jgi:hypothetical protein
MELMFTEKTPKFFKGKIDMDLKNSNQMLQASDFFFQAYPGQAWERHNATNGAGGQAIRNFHHPRPNR